MPEAPHRDVIDLAIGPMQSDSPAFAHNLPLYLAA